MKNRMAILGLLTGAIGIVFVLVGIYAMVQVEAGYDALHAFSKAQDVRLSYNDDDELVDRGTTEGAEDILELLEDDWGYNVRESELDPDDPLVDTGTEYMYQMATIAHHVLHGTQTIVLDESTEYEGEKFKKGEYTFDVDGRYWTDFDRMHPLEGPARGQAWSGTAHGLIAELGVGAVTASTLELGRGVALIIITLGLSFGFLGLGIVWAGRGVATLPPAA
jgi:hypothetical protein